MDKVVNNNYEASYMQESSYTALGGGKKSSRKYKGGMLSGLSPADFKGYAGCANWARGGGKRKSRKLRRKLKRGGTIRKTHESILTSGNVRYSEPLYGGRRKSRKSRAKKSRRY